MRLFKPVASFSMVVIAPIPDWRLHIYIVDRKKDMIISGGENIYSREIENVIYSHPSVQEVEVIGIPDEELGEAVLALIVPKEEEVIPEEEIIDFCKKQLASYKKPKKVEFLKYLPRTESGKIWKKGHPIMFLLSLELLFQ
ncbi:MAG: hypothetical protein SV375_07390 [Thermodesulfobacteriota bacterium]|nr:hypothetical protein [Thermodesulfobacteriota bacterium]